MLPASALPACGKKDPGPAPATSPAVPASPAAGPNDPDAASWTPDAVPEPFVFAKLPGRDITEADVAPRLKQLTDAGEKLDGRLVQETVEDVVEDALLVADARTAHYDIPADAKGDEAIAEAWAKQKFMADAQASVTDADLGQWFAERRGMARIVFKDEETATKAKAELDVALAAQPDAPLSTFLAAKGKGGKRRDGVPDGTLVDAQGKNELGETLLPEEGATVLFALTKDGEVSAPTKIGDAWLLLMRVAVRPGTPVALVPDDQKAAAKEKIVAARAMRALEEHVARLRKDQGVNIDELAIRRYAKTLGIESLAKVKRLPFGQRKAAFQKHRVPNQAPMRPAGRDIERLMQERARQKMQGQSTEPGAPGGHVEPGAHP